MTSLTVGILQAELVDRPQLNVNKIMFYIQRYYKNADIIVLPEYSIINPFVIKDPEAVYRESEYIASSRHLSTLAKLAHELSVHMVVHFVERTDQFPFTVSTTVLLTDRGEAIPVYSKIHLFDAYGYRESEFLKPGDKPGKIISIEGVKIAFTICYDLRFPELFRTYANMDVDVVIVQAGWVKGPLKEEVLDKLACTRAHENTIYLVIADQTGDMFVGRSGVFNPWGYRELDLGVEEKYVEHEVDIDQLKVVREILPVLRQARDKWEIRFIKQGSK
ncbi:MAG: nitrilase-related carbon-nitrogen hydrolase [Desulfurococcaceae archaeon]